MPGTASARRQAAAASCVRPSCGRAPPSGPCASTSAQPPAQPSWRGGGPRCPRQDCRHCRRQEPGGSPHLPRFLSSGRPNALPHRLHLPSCPKQLKALEQPRPLPLRPFSLPSSLQGNRAFIKQVAAAATGDGGGIYKDNRGWVGMKLAGGLRELATVAARSPSGSAVAPTQSVITQVGARTREG